MAYNRSLTLGAILISASKQRETKKPYVQMAGRRNFRLLTSNQHSIKQMFPWHFEHNTLIIRITNYNGTFVTIRIYFNCVAILVLPSVNRYCN
jgi:hypothetical protein